MPSFVLFLFLYKKMLSLTLKPFSCILSSICLKGAYFLTPLFLSSLCVCVVSWSLSLWLFASLSFFSLSLCLSVFFIFVYLPLCLVSLCLFASLSFFCLSVSVSVILHTLSLSVLFHFLSHKTFYNKNPFISFFLFLSKTRSHTN